MKLMDSYICITHGLESEIMFLAGRLIIHMDNTYVFMADQAI